MPSPPPTPVDRIVQDEIEDVEISALLEAVHLRYGYDFRNYARASLRRRVLRSLERSGFTRLSDLQHQILRDRGEFDRFLQELSIHVTALFRDPPFFRALRNLVAPTLQTFPVVRIWHAGCSTGEEVYSTAILLTELGLISRCQIYATDLSARALSRASTGRIPRAKLEEYARAYEEAGGVRRLEDYVVASDGDDLLLDPALLARVVFAQHNLATDGVFGEMTMIVCRNVLIYFNAALQERVTDLFADSLCRHGVLGIGAQESLRFLKTASRFEAWDPEMRIYRKVS